MRKFIVTKCLEFVALTILLWAATGNGASVVVAPKESSITTSSGMNSDVHVSADGRYVVFTSEADDLVTNDHNKSRDVFLRDRQAGTTALVSHTWNESTAANGASTGAAITPDGRYIVFESTATDLVASGFLPPSVGPNRSLIYRYDRQTGETILINVNRPAVDWDVINHEPAMTNVSWSLRAPVISPDGHRVLFEARAHFESAVDLGGKIEPELDDLFLWNDSTGETELMTHRFQKNPPETDAEYGSRIITTTPLMSDDGRYVAFARSMADVLSGSARNFFNLDELESVVHDRVTITNALPALNTRYTGGNAPRSEPWGFSADGEWLLFETRDSDQGGYVSGQAGYAPAQIWLYNMLTGVKTMVSTNASIGAPGSTSSFYGAISRDGNWAAYFSRATNLVADDTDAVIDVYLYDRQSSATIRISNDSTWHGLVTPYPEYPPQLTSNGRYVLYQAVGSGLYRYDRVAGTNALITADVETDSAAMSDDGRFVMFTDAPDSIDPNVANPNRQVYCRDLETGATELISVRDGGVPIATPNGPTSLELAAVSATGRYIAFTSFATDIGDGASRSGQLWVRDTQLGTNMLVSVDKDGQPLTGTDVFRNVQMSADGRWICFVSRSTSLVDNDSNRFDDVYLRDLQAGLTRLVSTSDQTGTSANGEALNPVMARDGSKIVFNSHAPDLLTGGGYYDLYGYDVASGITSLLTYNSANQMHANGPSDQQALSPDGRWMLFRTWDHYVSQENCFHAFNYIAYRDLTGNEPVHCVTNTLDSPPLLDGAVGKWSISGNGQWFVGNISFNNQTEVYLGRGGTNAAWLVGTNGYSPLVSNDGLTIAWESALPADGYTDTNGTWDVFHYRTDLGTLRVVSLDDTGMQTGNGASRLIGLSPDGRYVLIRSHASNLVSGDDNQSMDLFLRDTATDVTVLLSRNFSGNASADNFSGKAVFTDDGTKIIFESYASDIVANDRNLDRDIFVVQLQSTDSDHDGLPDDWELTYFGDLSHDGSADTDGDGVSDGDEFRAGTSPINSTSILRAITVTGINSATTTIMWSAVPGKSYQVQYRDSFSGTGWTNLGASVVAKGSTAGVDDAQVSIGQRFYRVMLVE